MAVMQIAGGSKKKMSKSKNAGDAKKKKPALVLGEDGTGSSGGSTWDRIRKFVDDHVWQVTKDKSMDDGYRLYSAPTFYANIMFDRKMVLFAIRLRRTLGGEIRTFELETRNPSMDLTEPTIRSLDQCAISLYFNRIDRTDSDVHIDRIAASPKHNIARGQQALRMAVALCKFFGAKRARLFDSSHLPCKRVNGKGDDDNNTNSYYYQSQKSVPLRPLRILTKGEGWYESHGFRSIEQILEPIVYRNHVSALHTVDMSQLEAALQQRDVALRRSILERTEVIGQGDVDGDGGISEPKQLELRDVMQIVERNSQLLDLLDELRPRGLIKATVGKTVTAVLKADCLKAVALVKELLPRRMAFVETIGGTPITPRPAEASWRYVESLSDELIATF